MPAPVGASWYRWRSEPQMAVRSTVTMTPSGPGRTGSGTFSTVTRRGPWRTVARTSARYRAGLHSHGPKSRPDAPASFPETHASDTRTQYDRRWRRGHRRLLRIRGPLGHQRLERRRDALSDRDPGFRRDLRSHGRAGRQAGLADSPNGQGSGGGATQGRSRGRRARAAPAQDLSLAQPGLTRGLVRPNAGPWRPALADPQRSPSIRSSRAVRRR